LARLVYFMKYIAVFFTIFIILIVILANRGQLGPIGFIYDFPYGDKLGHFILFGLLNFFLTLTCVRALPLRSPKRVALSISLILALIIGAEEYSQKFFEKRTFDMIDLTASYFGLVVGGWLAYRLKK
jgi:VanZ family protein